MIVRRLSLAAVFALAVAVGVAFAGPQVTVILTNGQQFSGSLIAPNNGNSVSLDVSGQQMTWPDNQVGVIEFTPGQPDPQELQQVSNTAGNRRSVLGGLLASSTAAVVLQDGQIISGRFAGFSNDGNQVMLDTSNGRNNYMASDIARLYVNPSAANNLFASGNYNNYNSQGAIGTSGQLTQPLTITVNAQRQWTPTNISVRQGEQLVFSASGQISFGHSPGQQTGPEGKNEATQISEGYPLPTAGAGALIGRVGNGQPFMIGTYSGPITMPASGPLYVGVNDNQLGDNSGSFSVQISRANGGY